METGDMKVDIRLPGKANLKIHGARPVHQIIPMMKWIRTSRLSIKESRSLGQVASLEGAAAEGAAEAAAMKQQADGTNQEYEAAIDELEYTPAPFCIQGYLAHTKHPSP